MERASLFSFLGTRNYDDIIYQLPSGKTTATKFSQVAIYEEIKHRYEHITICVFLTASAKKANWDPSDSSSLRFALDALPAERVSIRPVTIPEDQDDKANWELFRILLNHMQPNDIVYFDMTYGFRSIPFVSFIVLQYAQNLKNITLGGLYYGMIDTPKPGYGLINDFTQMMNLVNWADGVNQYVRTGNATVINQLVDAEHELHNEKGAIDSESKTELMNLERIARHMNQVSQSFETVRGETILQEIHELSHAIKQFDSEQSDYLQALIPILDKVNEKIAPFQSTKADQIKFTVDWCIEHGLYQQAYTFLLEFIINGFCDYLQRDKYNFIHRSFVQAVVRIVYQTIPENKWKVHPNFKRQLRHIIHTGQMDRFTPYFHAYVELNKDRNDINHAGINTYGKQFKHFEHNIKKYKEQLFPLIDLLYKQKS